MQRTVVVDTHALLWFATGSKKLSFDAWAVMEAPETVLCLPAIAAAELFLLVEKSKAAISVEEVESLLTRNDRIEVLPLDYSLVRRAAGLTQFKDLHDRLIVASAIEMFEEGLAEGLVTADLTISSSGLVPIVW